MSNDPFSKLTVDHNIVASEVEKLLNNKLNQEMVQVKRELENHWSHSSKWIIGLLLFLLLGLNGFLCYLVLQQSQQINELTEQISQQS